MEGAGLFEAHATHHHWAASQAMSHLLQYIHPTYIHLLIILRRVIVLLYRY